MKKYKLIKEFPGSVKLGTIINLEDVAFGITNNYTNYPEFWKEIKDEYPKIVAFKSLYEHENGRILWYNDVGKCIKVSDDSGIAYKIDFETALQDSNCEIYQVATSPTEIFTVGDRVKWKYGTKTGKIVKFILGGSEIIVYTEDCTFNVNNIEKSPTPLFTIEDGKEMFDGDIVYGICPDNWGIFSGKIYPESNWVTEKWKYGKFSSKEAAENYISKNKPKFSVKDIEDALKDLPYKIGGYDVYLHQGLFKQKLGI